MAREFARKFYNSSAWRKCRAAYIAHVNHACERCDNIGYIVHHRKHLTPSNINDAAITLSFDNLEYLCLDCHNAEHMGTTATTASGLAFINGRLSPKL